MELQSCPICLGNLEIREYRCQACEISFTGSFASPWFSGLSMQQSEFIKLFIIVQGNIKEMEKRLGISYPTVKNRLAEIIRSIVREEPSPNDYGDVIADLEQGFINVDEAISMIESRRKP